MTGTPPASAKDFYSLQWSQCYLIPILTTRRKLRIFMLLLRDMLYNDAIPVLEMPELYKSLTQNLMSEFVSSHFPVFPAPPSSSTCSSTLSSQILHGLLARSNFLALHHTPIKIPETFSVVRTVVILPNLSPCTKRFSTLSTLSHLRLFAVNSIFAKLTKRRTSDEHRELLSQISPRLFNNADRSYCPMEGVNSQS